VQELARAKGYNISTFARAAGLAMNTARDYWYGTVNKFDGDVLERVAAALDVTISDLFATLPDQIH
jgi:transcriptional regulator with XRE-family HTH domain